jgi:hypothetical protein
MSEDLSPAQHVAAIDAARQRMINFVRRCSDEQWLSAPIDGDPRPVAVIADHTAHAYEYLAGWMGEIIAGGSPEVTAELVDGLNAEHAAEVGRIGPVYVVDHLKAAGDSLIALVGGLEPEQLELGDGQVGRFAVIAARHADTHREEIEAALAGG